MGIVYQQNSKFYVYEAVHPVKLTPIKTWINRGVKNNFVVSPKAVFNSALLKTVVSYN